LHVCLRRRCSERLGADLQPPISFRAGRDADALDLLSRDKTASPPDGDVRRDITDDDDDDDDDDEREEEEERGRVPAAVAEDGRAKEKEGEQQKRRSLDREDFAERIDRAKTLARSEIKLQQWNRYGFCKLDLDKELGPYGDDLIRRHCDEVPHPATVHESGNEPVAAELASDSAFSARSAGVWCMSWALL
jgi:hypothetical protein